MVKITEIVFLLGKKNNPETGLVASQFHVDS